MLCLLAKNCTEAAYTRLVEALPTEHSIMLMRVRGVPTWVNIIELYTGGKVDDNTKLGEWVGLCKIDKEGKPRKVVKCSCVVIKVSMQLVLCYTWVIADDIWAPSTDTDEEIALPESLCSEMTLLH